MKKVITILLVFIFTISAVIPLSASSTGPMSSAKQDREIEAEAAKTKLYYRTNKTTLTDWQETIIYSATGILESKTSPVIWELGENPAPVDYAKRILTLIATNVDPKTDNGIDLGKTLADKQGEDGSFGNLFGTVYSVIALEAVKETYDNTTAMNNIISYQNEDGGFSFSDNISSDIDTTSISLTALSIFKGRDEVKISIDKALEFIKSVQNEEGGFTSFGKDNSNSLAVTIMALCDLDEVPESEEWNYMVTSLLRFKNNDDSYRHTLEDEKVANDIATVQALMALDTVLDGSSPYKRLAINGTLEKEIDVQSLRPMIFVYIGLAACAAFVWVWIFIRKPKTQTLEESKSLYDIAPVDPDILKESSAEDKNETEDSSSTETTKIMVENIEESEGNKDVIDDSENKPE